MACLVSVAAMLRACQFSACNDNVVFAKDAFVHACARVCFCVCSTYTWMLNCGVRTCVIRRTLCQSRIGRSVRALWRIRAAMSCSAYTEEELDTVLPLPKW